MYTSDLGARLKETMKDHTDYLLCK